MNPHDQIPFNVTRSAEILQQTPYSVSRMLCDLSPEWTESNGDTGNWSPYDVVGHLIHCEETNWIPRAEVILVQGKDRTFVPFDRFAQFENSGGKSLGDLLTEFAHIRNLNIEKLLGWQLTPEQLALQGVHPQFGEITLEQLLSTWVVHDLTHVRQIVTYLAAKYSENVGPWKAYLSILNK
ncbi:MAG: DinB family protein [Acidobacteriota bacterium]